MGGISCRIPSSVFVIKLLYWLIYLLVIVVMIQNRNKEGGKDIQGTAWCCFIYQVMYINLRDAKSSTQYFRFDFCFLWKFHLISLYMRWNITIFKEIIRQGFYEELFFKLLWLFSPLKSFQTCFWSLPVYSNDTWVTFPVTKRFPCGAGHSPPSRPEIKNRWT